MLQRVSTRAWYSPGREGRRPRVLVEDDNPALAISDFWLLQQAGFDVAYCSGPGGGSCPLLAGGSCRLLAGADAVLHGLDPALGIAAAIQRRYPGVAVVARQGRRSDGSLEPLPPGCTPLAALSSVQGQIDALRRALASPRPGGGGTAGAAGP